MNKIFKISAMLLAGVLAFGACQKEPVLKLTDVGPDMTVSSYTQSTYMGADIKFSVNLSDKEFDLSTLKAALFYGDEKVSEVTIRTKQYGSYEGTIHAPLLKKIPNGNASLALTSQNVGMGITTDTVSVSLKRPDFPELTFKAKNGQTVKMKKGEGYVYTATGNFPTDMQGVVETPAVDGQVITLGWTGSELSELNGNPIPFSSSLSGEYTISVDLLELTASPFNYLLSTEIDLSEGKKEGVYALRQNIGLKFTGINDIADWDIDPDFFTLNEAEKTITFDAVDGYYKLIANFNDAYIRTIPCDENGNALKRGQNNDGAIYMIGGNFGKPSFGPSWNTTDGAYAFAQIAPKVFRLTLNVGSQIKEGFSLKIFSEMGWGDEFGKANYAKFDGAGVFALTDSGNIEIAAAAEGQSAVKLAEKKAYCFTMDLTNGFDKAEMTVKEVEVIGGAALDIQVNGAKADKLSKTIYKVKALKLKKGDEITFTGIEDADNWYIDADHFSMGGDGAVCPECGQPLKGLRFNAVEGYYSIELNLGYKFVTVRRVKADGSNATFKDDGAIIMMGWGVAHPYMADFQLAWETGALITLAEVEDGVYQFTGKAVAEKDTTYGGHWRYDYLSFKFFGQSGWGDEQGTVTLTDAAAQYLAVPGNLELASGVKLEEGAVYQMTVRADNTGFTGGKFDVAVDFVRK